MPGKSLRMPGTMLDCAAGATPTGVGAFQCGTISIRFAGSARLPASRRVGWPVLSGYWTAPGRGAVSAEFPYQTGRGNPRPIRMMAVPRGMVTEAANMKNMRAIWA